MNVTTPAAPKKALKRRIPILAITQSDEVLLTTRKPLRGASYKVILITMLDANEVPEKAVRRKLSSIGYIPDEVVSLGKHTTRRAHGKTSAEECYLALNCREKQRTTKGVEIEIDLVPLRDWLDEIQGDGDVLEPATITTMIKALPHLRKRIM